MPECEAWSSVRTRSVKRVLPRSDTVSAGVRASQLPESATTMTSARSASALSARNCANEREPASSSPSMNSATPRSKSSPSASLQRAQRRDVRHDPGLVVGGAAAVQAPAADGRLERRGLPQRLVADRLHVVVRVEQDRRAAVARGARGEHRGLARSRPCRGSPRGGSRRCRTGRVPRRERRPPPRCAALRSRRNPGNAIDGMRTRAPRSARAAGMPDAAASRTASCRVSSVVMRVILRCFPIETPRFHRGQDTRSPRPRRRSGRHDDRRQGPRDADARRAGGRAQAPARRRHEGSQGARQGRARRSAREGPRRHGRRRRQVPSGPRQGSAAQVRARLHRLRLAPRRGRHARDGARHPRDLHPDARRSSTTRSSGCGSSSSSSSAT